MTQEALKLALEELVTYAWHGEACPQHPTYSEPKNYPKCTCGYDKAITAIKEALAQTQEPVKIVQYNCTCGRTMKFESVHGVVAPQRTWVGLTEDEAFACQGRDYFETYKAIEAKLKEKNT